MHPKTKIGITLFRSVAVPLVFGVIGGKKILSSGIVATIARIFTYKSSLILIVGAFYIYVYGFLFRERKELPDNISMMSSYRSLEVEEGIQVKSLDGPPDEQISTGQDESVPTLEPTRIDVPSASEIRVEVQRADVYLKRIELLEKTVEMIKSSVRAQRSSRHVMSESNRKMKGSKVAPERRGVEGRGESDLPPKYARMLSMGVPRRAVLQKMALDGVSKDNNSNVTGGVTAASLKSMRVRARKNGVRKRKPSKKALVKSRRGSTNGGLRITPSLLLNARKKLKKKSSSTKRTQSVTTSTGGGLGITVDLLHKMRSGLRRSRVTRRQKRKTNVENRFRGVLRPVGNAIDRSCDASGHQKKRNVFVQRLRKTNVVRSPGGTPLVGRRARLLGRRIFTRGSSIVEVGRGTVSTLRV